MERREIKTQIEFGALDLNNSDAKRLSVFI